MRRLQGFSLTRWLGILIKEFLQLRRDRLTFGMIIGMPIVQLVLFGYAINSDPRHLPTAVLVQDNSAFARSTLSAFVNTSFFDVTHVARTPQELDDLIRTTAIDYHRVKLSDKYDDVLVKFFLSRVQKKGGR